MSHLALPQPGEHRLKSRSSATHATINERLAEQITRRIEERKEWIGIAVSTADAGSDSNDDILAPYASEIVGIDVSSQMVDAYNQHAANQGLVPTEMHGIVGDLTLQSSSSAKKASLCGPEYFDFDLAVVGMALHHVQDVDLAVRRLLERVRVGKGVLLVLDYLRHEHVRGHDGCVCHDGFSEQEMIGVLERAGCKEVESVVLGRGRVRSENALSGATSERSLFMCRGTRQE
ncbi:MAG: hypothetical protein M1826_003187 [Phylliscum demangeonii]|nr:MAG: hypothetical protein M1826_003187 [Phylliscum demangeonii]